MMLGGAVSCLAKRTAPRRPSWCCRAYMRRQMSDCVRTDAGQSTGWHLIR